MDVLFGCPMSLTVLSIINIALPVVGAISHRGYRTGVTDLIYGDDLTVARWNIGIYRLVNILKTCLLAVNNCTIQVISWPTREMIDEIHARGGWLAVRLLKLHNWIALATVASILSGAHRRL